MAADELTRPREIRRCADDVREWAAKHFQTSGASIDRMVSSAIDHFCTDPVWTRRFVGEQLRQEIAATIAGAHRTMTMVEAAAADPEPPVVTPPIKLAPPPKPEPAPQPKKPSPKAIRKLVQNEELRGAPRWATRMAVIGEQRMLRPMLKLTRDEVLEGADWLQGRADICRDIACRLQPGQTVGEVFTEQQLMAFVYRRTKLANPTASAAD